MKVKVVLVFDLSLLREVVINGEGIMNILLYNLLPYLCLLQLSASSPDPSISFGFPNIRWHQTADYGYVPNARMQNVFMAVAMDLPGFSSKFGG